MATHGLHWKWWNLTPYRGHPIVNRLKTIWHDWSRHRPEWTIKIWLRPPNIWGLRYYTYPKYEGSFFIILLFYFFKLFTLYNEGAAKTAGPILTRHSTPFGESQTIFFRNKKYRSMTLELSTGHFSWTRPDPAKRWPDPRLLTKSLTRPVARSFPHMYSLYLNNNLLIS